MSKIAHNRVMRLSIRGLITSDGSLGKAKKPSTAFQIRHFINQKGHVIPKSGLKKKKLQKKVGTFITWFLVSIVNLGSTDTRVVQALNASACSEKS